MEIFKKLEQKQRNLQGSRQITIAFLGDSVTQGCFELYRVGGNDLATVYDSGSAYHAKLCKMLGVLFPEVPVNIINAGINGDNAPKGLARLERDVLSYHPDLTVVCFGLNDVSKGSSAIGEYTAALEQIFDKIRDARSELIFMTPNMRNIRVNGRINDPLVSSIAEGIAQSDAEEGVFDKYIMAARELCRVKKVKLCDCYAVWKRMDKSGVDVSRLLANDVNHPSRELHNLFAYELLKTMLED